MPCFHKDLSKILKSPFQISVIELEKLREHEGVDPRYLKELEEEIRSDGILKFAIAVDKNTNVILDGHHRLNALKKIGCKRIPVVFVDYNSPAIEVKARKNGEKLTKRIVIEAALNGKKLPPKASKHMVRVSGELKHILSIEKRVNMPLSKLRN